MKVLFLLGVVLLAAESFASSDLYSEAASVDNAVSQSTASYESFMQATYNGTCGSCGCKSCCPVIVRNCPPKFVGSVIQGYGEWMGNAAIIVDWGCTEYNPCGCRCAKGRLCTVKDVGFRWFINWGDGSTDHGWEKHLGPFQKTHQYDRSCTSRSYGVTVYYCSDPGCPAERCCDSIYRVIDVNGGTKDAAGVNFNKPLAEQ